MDGIQQARAPRRGSYGIDAPYVPVILGLVGVAMLVSAGIDLAGGGGGTAVLQMIVGLFFLACAASYLYTTRRGKFDVWADLLDGLALHGEERVLDLGCGRGAVLLMAAERLTGGRAVGVDLWRSVDQSGNSTDATEANARAEGVAERVELHTGDMTALPFGDAEFDVIVSSLAIHNIPTAEGRATAIDEAARVLRPGGRLALVDFRHADAYERRLAECGVTDLHRRGLGWRFWYGGPWTAGKLVTGRKPG